MKKSLKQKTTITLTTDFGLKDSYVGSVKSAILSVNPKAAIVNISHLITQHNIKETAFTLLSAYSDFPGCQKMLKAEIGDKIKVKMI